MAAWSRTRRGATDMAQAFAPDSAEPKTRRTIFKQNDLGCFPLVRSRVAERHSELQNRPRTRYRTSRTFGVLNNLKLCLEHDLKMANHVRCGRCRFVSRSLVLSTIRRSAKCSSIRLYFGAHHPSEPTLHCECNSGPIILRIFIFFFTTLGHFSVLLCCAALLCSAIL